MLRTRAYYLDKKIAFLYPLNPIPYGNRTSQPLNNTTLNLLRNINISKQF